MAKNGEICFQPFLVSFKKTRLYTENKICAYYNKYIRGLANMKKAVIRSDIKTGIKVAGFMDFITKEFDEIMTIQNNQDIDNFMEQYDLSVVEIKKEQTMYEETV